MANWQGFSLTDKGFALQAKINAGKAMLKFTKISIGSGVAGNGVPSNLVQKEKDLTIGSITPEGQLVKIVTTLTNEGVQKAFKEREMGLYAQDPDEGEIMYAYMIDQDPDTLPAEGSTTIVSKRLTLALTFSNTGNVTAVLDSKQLLTFGDLETKADDGTGASTADNKAATPAWVREQVSNGTSGMAAQSWVQNLLSTFTNFKTSQITDFADGLIKKLALTTTIGGVNALQTNSWFGQLLKMVLTASGVKYNIAQNGYVCLGSFFGGLIIQWGDYDNANGLSAITYPISLKNKPFVIVTTEGDPAGWNNNINGIAIAGADIITASNAKANILSKWIVENGSILRQGQNVRVVIIGI